MSRSSEKIMEEIEKLLEELKREENSKASMMKVITELSDGDRNYILYECFKALTDELKAARDNK